MKDHLDALGRTSVITGAGSGLGRSLAIALGRLGWSVGIAEVNMEGAGETLEMVRKAGGGGDVFRCDVRSREEVSAMAEHFEGSLGPAVMLVNNAGVTSGGLVGDIPDEDWRRVMDTNLWGAINGCQVYVPKMKASGGGHIVNVASSAGIACLPEMAPYNVAKAAVISLSETLRAELRPANIGVTVACPTFFNTNLLDDMTCTDEFQSEFAHAAFENARSSSDEVAAAIVRGVRKNKLYVFPQSAAKFVSVTKRLSPSMHHRFIAMTYGTGRARSLMLRMARRGMI